MVWGLECLNDPESYVDWSRVLLLGIPMSDRSKGKDQTKSDHWPSSLGVGHWANNPVMEKIRCYGNSNRRT